MSWENIIKRNCGCGKDPCETYGIKKRLSGKQKKLDRNKNGKIDGEDFRIMGNDDDTLDKSPTRKHYTKDGKEWKGNTHKMPNGTVHTNKSHTKTSQKLVHYKDLSKKAKARS